MTKSRGLQLLGLWVVLSNLLPLLSIRVPNSGVLLLLLGVISGVLILLDR